MRQKSPELLRAMELMQKELYYVVQVRHPGEVAWSNVPDLEPIRGKEKAYEDRDELALLHPKSEYRVIQKDQADMYISGIKAGQALSHTKEGKHRPVMYMPENL